MQYSTSLKHMRIMTFFDDMLRDPTVHVLQHVCF
jgi:hypothetical protein